MSKPNSWPKWAALLSAWILTGCFTSQPHSTLDAIGEATGHKSNSPFVEAYIEYPGPASKWAGPTTMVLHISAKEAGIADISMAPQFPGAPNDEKGPRRTIASDKAITAEVARAELAKLGTMLLESDQKFEGCLSPIRVKMVRQDGSVFEKQGCRTQVGWPGVVSKMVSELIPLGV